jgi:hypothetical protein
MKNFKSTKIGTWVEMLDVELSEEQKAILISFDRKAVAKVISEIEDKRAKSVTAKNSSDLKDFYNKMVPVLNSGDVYEFICVELTKKENGDLTGILNCRINGVQAQVRV